MTTEENTNGNIPLTDYSIKFNTVILSPSATITSLQVICFFDFQKNQHYSGGTAAVNEHFGGEIHEIRKSGIFKGLPLETLLLTPILKQIPASQLLMVGMGDPEKLSLDLLEAVAYTVTTEAIKLGVTEFCFAPSLKDAGLTLSFGKTDVATALQKGMTRAANTASELFKKNLMKPVVLTDINLLRGKA